jgi:uncharacterized protein YbjT (DUF2867 family)
MSSVKNVAIVGAGGNIGSAIAAALVSSGLYNVTALTRPDSTNVMPSNLNVIKTDYSHASLVSALTGQDALVITMSVFAAPDTQLRLIDAAVEAKVKFIVPSEWGSDPENMASFTKDVWLHDGMMAVRNHLKAKNAAFIGVACSFWYEYSLSGTEIRYGFDFPSKTVTLFGDGETKINTSTWPQVGRAVAAILKEPEKWAGGSVYVRSFWVSQRDMLEAVERVTEEKWTVHNEGVYERYQRGAKMLGEGNMEGFGIGMYARGFYPDDSLTKETSNEALGLPVEDFDEATEVAVEMARGKRSGAAF